MIKDPTLVADTIKGLVKELNVSEQNVATSVAGYSVIIKRITVGKMTEEELASLIEMQEEIYSKLEPDELTPGERLVEYMMMRSFRLDNLYRSCISQIFLAMCPIMREDDSTRIEYLSPIIAAAWRAMFALEERGDQL